MPETPLADAPAVDLEAAPTDNDGWPILPPTLITVHRTSPEDVRDRQVIFSIDGERVAQLLFGQTFTREIVPGRHRLRANNTLVWKTVEFDAAPGAHLHFTCVNRAPRWLYYLIAIFGVAPLLVTLEPGRPERPA
jgi:hypothetical protein